MTTRALAYLLVLALSMTSCALVSSPEPVDFTTYSLGEIPIDEAQEVVQTVTQRFSTERFGGREFLWDPATRNLSLDPVYDDTRRMSLYVHLKEGADAKATNVDILALVETLLVGTLNVEWGEPKKDIFLEEMLHQAYVDEIVARRE